MDETLKEPIPQTMVDQVAKEPLRLGTDGGLTESDDSLTLVRRHGCVSSDEDSESPRQRQGWCKGVRQQKLRDLVAAEPKKGHRGSHPQKAVADRGGCLTKYTVEQIVNFPEPGRPQVSVNGMPLCGSMREQYSFDICHREGKVALDYMDVRN